MQWQSLFPALWCSRTVRADAVVTQSRALELAVVFSSALLCTKRNWFHWDASQDKVQFTAIKGTRIWVGRCIHTAQEGDTVQWHASAMGQAE